jgi:hypothetical protein
MEPELIREMFVGLDAHALPIGPSFVGATGDAAVPFFCESHPFIAMYRPIVLNEDTYQGTRASVWADAQHEVSQNAYIMKFASVAQWCDGNGFAPLNASPEITAAIRRAIPQRLAKATAGFLGEVPEADELYFIAGAETERRMARLNLWYSRISDTIAAEQLGLRPIHPKLGNEWYGYRKA